MDHETAMQRLLEARDRIAELEAALRRLLNRCDHYKDRPHIEAASEVVAARAALKKQS